MLAAACSISAQAGAETISGAGSTAAAPIYQVWAREYGKVTGTAFAYESVGSSAGLKKIRGGETGFGASDVAPTESELAKDGLVLFPVAITGIAPVVNLPHVADGELRLSGEVLARIFMGEIRNWSAPELRQLNPGVSLPDLAIRVVVRADGSGTTFNFTDYLSKESPAWKQRYGAKTLVAWPAGAVAMTGSEGVVKDVKEHAGAIGYADFGYVSDYKLASAQVRNADGEFVRASVPGFRAALAASDWSATGSFTSTLTSQRGKATWPITMGTFVVVPRVSNRPEQTAAALKFFLWAFNHGDALVQQANFVRLPDRVQASAFKAIASVKDKQGKALGLGAL
ncbi:phosphate ABC transporter substrate-binding protein PstS [Ramlibacter sp. G-1-2-2]|uniref:Phosphate-binding protein PstS n=1 Tax=Ramlibacter agri TaxID=2728837 RepID=A0A848HB27_9BURK|nr:phosphate ABC transporter substrate-binding protein PstS [Ramlibacter agri]NML46709.1 phosphate ABC transporter substrate-binding protein PstS [Ramlibacter agri]